MQKEKKAQEKNELKNMKREAKIGNKRDEVMERK